MFRILIFLVVVALLFLFVNKLRKMIKTNQTMDIDEELQSIRGNRVFGVFAGGAVLAGLCLWFFLSMDSAELGSKHNVEKYTFNNHVLSFDVPQYRTSYEVSLPLYVDIKPNDKVEVRYVVDKGKLQNITGVFVNDNAVHDGSYQLVYKEIKTHR